MTSDSFIQAIVEDQEQDKLRLIYADWLDDLGQHERAEFIRIQCKLDKSAAEDSERHLLQMREQELLTRNEKEWLGPISDVAECCSMRRGFLDSIRIPAEVFLAHADTILACPLLRHVEFTLWFDTSRLLLNLNNSPHLTRLKTISLTFGCSQINDSELQHLAELPFLLERLHALFILESNITNRGLQALLLSSHLLRLQSLSIVDCGLNGDIGIQPLCGSSRQLDSLCLSGNDLGDSAVKRLVSSPNCQRLQHLDISSCTIGDESAEQIAASPYVARLVSLNLDNNTVSSAGARSLARSMHLGMLQYLHLRQNLIDADGVEILMNSSQLRCLKWVDCYWNGIDDTVKKRLKSSFGGRLRV